MVLNKEKLKFLDLQVFFFFSKVVFKKKRKETPLWDSNTGEGTYNIDVDKGVYLLRSISDRLVYWGHWSVTWLPGRGRGGRGGGGECTGDHLGTHHIIKQMLVCWMYRCLPHLLLISVLMSVLVYIILMLKSFCYYGCLQCNIFHIYFSYFPILNSHSYTPIQPGFWHGYLPISLNQYNPG